MNAPISLADCLNREVIDRKEELARRFRDARPFRHVVIDNFLDEELLRSVCEQFPPFAEDHAINENKQVGGKAVQEKVSSLGPAFEQLDRMASDDEFLDLVATITGVKNLNYDPHYFGGGTHENRHGQDLDAHIDFNYHPITRQHRRLNLIVYLNEEWDERWGGALQLHRDPHKSPAEDEIVTVNPILNRCVIFETTEHSWHGFERIDLPEDKRELSRKSFALYYYTDTRPQEQTADEHSTVYVERHLDERFQPGMTLTDADLQEVRTLLARRDQHLQRLYGDIQNLNRQLDGVRQSRAPKVEVARVAADGNGGIESIDTSDPEALAGELKSAMRMIQVLRKRVGELESSTSWRITAPLRALKRLVAGG